MQPSVRLLDGDPPNPIHDGPYTYLWWEGPADDVRLRHYMPNFPDPGPFHHLPESHRWVLKMELPRQARIEYLLSIRRGDHVEAVLDSRNPLMAANPFGVNSVLAGIDYSLPWWAEVNAEVPKGRLTEIRVQSPSQRLRYKVYLPHGYQRRSGHPMLLVHDGSDYLAYASFQAVVDNLVARDMIEAILVVFIDPGQRNREYAADEAHARHLVEVVLPHLRRRHGVGLDTDLTGVMGASLGAVASLHAAWKYPDTFGRLLLQSGAFVGHLSAQHHADPFEPIVTFMQQFGQGGRIANTKIYVSCGRYEGLREFNRQLVPSLVGADNDVRYEEAWDGHHWQAWRDRLASALTFLFPGPAAESTQLPDRGPDGH